MITGERNGDGRLEKCTYLHLHRDTLHLDAHLVKVCYLPSLANHIFGHHPYQILGQWLVIHIS